MFEVECFVVVDVWYCLCGGWIVVVCDGVDEFCIVVGCVDEFGCVWCEVDYVLGRCG